MMRFRWLYVLAAAVVGVPIWAALFGVKTRYSCGEGWDVSVASRSEAVSECTAGDVPRHPTIVVDSNIDLRMVALTVGIIVATVPPRIAARRSASAMRQNAHG